LYFYHQGQTVAFEIQRDEPFIKLLIATAMDFWAAVKSGREPKKDPERDLYLPKGDDERRWQQLAAYYRQNAVQMDELKVQLKALESAQLALEQHLVQLMGEYLAAEHSGLRVNRFQIQGAIDYKAVLQALLPTVSETVLDSYRKPASQRVRITCRDETGKHAEVPFDAAVLNEMVRCDHWF
jgi:hypothetical protein